MGRVKWLNRYIVTMGTNRATCPGNAFVKPHLVNNPTLSNVPNISLIEIEYKPELSTKSSRLNR
jgi:hypothetical protein